MKYLLLLLLSSSCLAQTKVQSQDIGGSSITRTAPETFKGSVTNIGSTTFSGAVAISSCTDDLFNISVVQPTPQFSISIATVQFSVTGNNPVKICFSGAEDTNGSGALAAWNFIVDGAFVNGLTSSIGAYFSNSVCNGCTMTLSSCYPVKAGVIAAGSHKFGFMPSAGIGNTAVMGGAGHQTITKFCVEEQH